MIYVIRHSLLYFPLQSRVSPRVSPEVMTVFLSACALITVLETLTENDLKWLMCNYLAYSMAISVKNK